MSVYTKKITLENTKGKINIFYKDNISVEKLFSQIDIRKIKMRSDIKLNIAYLTRNARAPKMAVTVVKKNINTEIAII